MRITPRGMCNLAASGAQEVMPERGFKVPVYAVFSYSRVNIASIGLLNISKPRSHEEAASRFSEVEQDTIIALFYLLYGVSEYVFRDGKWQIIPLYQDSISDISMTR